MENAIEMQKQVLYKISYTMISHQPTLAHDASLMKKARRLP